MTDPDPAIVARIVAEMRRARRLLFITGAGISADSGLPTYRGIGGLYNDELTEDSFSIETALSGSMLEAAGNHLEIPASNRTFLPRRLFQRRSRHHRQVAEPVRGLRADPEH
jgi:NAD-dependent SIR2 family protein deacetylase